jgi:hypothetical protein
VFERLVKAKNGEEFATFQVSLRRSYQDAEGKGQHTPKAVERFPRLLPD